MDGHRAGVEAVGVRRMFGEVVAVDEIDLTAPRGYVNSGSAWPARSSTTR
jgi:hypothetical protein